MSSVTLRTSVSLIDRTGELLSRVRIASFIHPKCHARCVDWDAWRPTYEQILADFGYERAADERARDVLDALLADRLRADLDALAASTRGREAWIVGAAVSPADLARAPPDAPLFVADAAAHMVVPFRKPTAIVTDLDGNVPLQMAANAMGVPLLVHAHGDNVEALRAHVPQARGPIAGTTQAEPKGRVLGFGGFTDGDRAACIAVALGAASLALAGFDFDAPLPKEGRDPETKRRKLAWAKRIIESLDVPVRFV